MTAAVDSSTHSEEPWDQRGLVETAASAIRNWKAEEEELGELPSLATTKKKAASSPPSKKEPIEMPSSSRGQRKEFWTNMEHAADTLTNDHGPDDEMAAHKKAVSRRRRHIESESQLTDEEEFEEEEEETYEATFCGSTMLGELCGRSSALQMEPPSVRVRSFSPRSASSDQHQEQTAIEVEFVDKPNREVPKEAPPSDSETSSSRRLSHRAKRAKETMKNRRAFRKAQSTSPQESQTSEVSTPEKTPETPEKSTHREIVEEQQDQEEQLEVELEPEMAPPPSPSTLKKNARLAAIAKKARDNFQIRKGKPANVVTEPVQAKSTRQHRSSPTKKSVDEDYASFTATEKRIFIKLINSGMPATEATQRVIQDRGLEMSKKQKKPATSPSRKPFWKKDPPLERTMDPPGEASMNEPEIDSPEVDSEEIESNNENEATEGESGEHEENPDKQIVSPLVSKLSAASPRNIQSKQSSDLKTTSSDDLFPFERTGLTYFDATRREKDEDLLYRDAAKRPSSGRLTPKFLSGKSPRFSELMESPERRSNSAPPSRSLESTSQSRSITINDLHESQGEADNSGGAVTLQGLVPRMAKRYQKVAESNKLAAVGSDVSNATQSRGLTPLRAPSGDEDDDMEQLPTSSETQNESLDMDKYLDSAKEGFVPANSTSDTASVYTTGTNVTGMTSYTNSTRSRRPGAAKSRLAKHKQHETEAAKQLGWRQSIQAAAQTNNRKWDPERGWVDYEEPDVFPDTVPLRHEKMKVDLNKSKLKTGQSKVQASPPQVERDAISIPFPDEWASEREAMIQAKSNADPVKADNRGWVESMKIASAQQAKDGSSWDKDRGWTDGKRDKTADSVDFSGRSRPLQLDTQTLQPVRGIAQESSRDSISGEETDQLESTDDDNMALLGSQRKQGPMSPMVEVIKQKVNENDIYHFSPTLAQSSGPVDVDEVTKIMEEEIDKNHAIGDPEKRSSQESPTKNRSAGRNDKNKSAQRNIPKLNRSLRDTSPIAFRKKEKRDSSSEDDILIDTTKSKPDGREKSARKDFDSQDERLSGTSSIKDRMKTWETRIGASNSVDTDDNQLGPKQVLTPGGSYSAAGWKTFLGKKVREGRDPGDRQHARDKLKGSPEVSALNISDISPIDVKSEDEAEYGSSAYGPNEADLKSPSLLKRLSECASPVLASTYKSQSMVPPALCGRRSADDEDSSIAESESSEEIRKHSSKSRNEEPKHKVSAAYSVASSSVVSEDFGVKTAYLDAVAMKTAVSGSRRPTSRRRARSSASSVASSTATDHSDKWRQLLEKRRSSGRISSRLSSSDISRATEKYASDKVSEIMQNISSRSKTVARSREVHREHEKSPQRPLQDHRRTHHEKDSGVSSDEDISINAAEDLAAARVEAMMAALSADQGAEGEI